MEILYYDKRRVMPDGRVNKVTDYKLEKGVVYCKKPADTRWWRSDYSPKGLHDTEMFTPKFTESLENK